jgi:chorismate mutase/prephenate dehydratase
MKLDDCRKVIDEIDSQILILLNRRANLSQRIGLMKTSAGLPIVDETREDTVIRRLVRENPGDLGDAALANIYREILDESRRIQRSVAVNIETNGEPRL